MNKREMIDLWAVKGTTDFVQEGYFINCEKEMSEKLFAKMLECSQLLDELDLAFEELGGVWS